MCMCACAFVCACVYIEDRFNLHTYTYIYSISIYPCDISVCMCTQTIYLSMYLSILYTHTRTMEEGQCHITLPTNDVVRHGGKEKKNMQHSATHTRLTGVKFRWRRPHMTLFVTGGKKKSMQHSATQQNDATLCSTPHEPKSKWEGTRSCVLATSYDGALWRYGGWGHHATLCSTTKWCNTLQHTAQKPNQSENWTRSCVLSYDNVMLRCLMSSDKVTWRCSNLTLNNVMLRCLVSCRHVTLPRIGIGYSHIVFSQIVHTMTQEKITGLFCKRGL